MKFAYTIEITATDPPPYAATAYTEGRLEVWQGGGLLLNVTGILLVEFAIELEEWCRKIRRKQMSSLHYASMDFEEEPIFALDFDPVSGCFKPGSVWQIAEGVPVSAKVALRAASDYTKSLGQDLEAIGVNLDKIIQDTIGTY